MDKQINPKIFDIDGWMSHDELRWLHAKAQMAPVGSVIIEIGAWLGRSSAALYTGIQDGVTVISIDTWQGQLDLRDTIYKLANEQDVHKLYVDNMVKLGLEPKPYGGKIEPGIYYLIAKATDAANLFPDACVDWWYNDGNHMELGVDIDAWLSKVKTPGILSGHDYFRFKAVQRDIHDRFCINEIHASNWVHYLYDQRPEWW